MAVDISASRASTLFAEHGLDGVFEPEDVPVTRNGIVDLDTPDATGASITDTLIGFTSGLGLLGFDAPDDEA